MPESWYAERKIEVLLNTTHRYRKLVLRDGRLQGAILVGWPEWIEPLSKAVKAHAEISAHLEALKIGRWKPLLWALPELLKAAPAAHTPTAGG